MDLEHPLFVNLPLAMEAFSDYPGNSIDRRVFADISQFANRRGISFTTEKAIAGRTGIRREEVSKSVNRLKEKGFLTITPEKKGLDRHPRNVYHIAKRFLRRHPDKRSPHYNAEAWRRWCEIGKKRAITIALKKKQAAQAAARTVRDTAAAMAGKRPTTASASQLTPAQASQARQQRGGGFASFGSVLSGLFRATPAAAATPAADTYETELRRRGEIAQTLRQNEAQQARQQAATVMAIQLPQQAAAPMVATLAVPPITQDRAAASQSQPKPTTTAPKQYETDLSAEPLPLYYQQQQGTADSGHTWRDNVPGYRHETATGDGPTTTAPAETVAANCKSEPSYVPGSWRHNVPAAYRHKTATVGATASTQTPAQANAGQQQQRTADSGHTWRDNVPGYRHKTATGETTASTQPEPTQGTAKARGGHSTGTCDVARAVPTV